MKREKSRNEVAKLLEKYVNEEEPYEMIKAHYGKNTMIQTYGYGIINFSPSSRTGIKGGESISYNDYLDLQFKSAGKSRGAFEMCYIYEPDEFMGEVEKITNNHICFKRIYVSGTYDFMEYFEGREDHVWMDKDGFGDCKVGDCFKFYADVYRYIKTGNGKVLDYGLRKPQNVQKIKKYELPTDKELMRQQVREIICETCVMSERCSRMNCEMPASLIKEKMMMEILMPKEN